MHLLTGGATVTFSDSAAPGTYVFSATLNDGADTEITRMINIVVSGGAPVCGNSVVEDGEDCDPPDGATCDENCHTTQEPVCGNGVVEDGENCDPPDGSTCDENCHTIQEPVCGNGVIEDGETCDPPNAYDCTYRCTWADPEDPYEYMESNGDDLPYLHNHESLTRTLVPGNDWDWFVIDTQTTSYHVVVERYR